VTAAVKLGQHDADTPESHHCASLNPARDSGARPTMPDLAAFASKAITREVPTLNSGDPDTDLMDVVFNYGLSVGHCGYLVGLAVGLALASGRPFESTNVR